MRENNPYISYNKSNQDFAEQNRKSMTKSEQRMRFEVLKNKPLGYRFIKQKMIGSFILDFYCSKLLLGIEVDGNSHDEKQIYDHNRTSLLNDYDIKILRYMNDDVLYNLKEVYEDLCKQMKIREVELKRPRNNLDI